VFKHGGRQRIHTRSIGRGVCIFCAGLYSSLTYLSTAHNALTSPLLCLPAELRNEIWNYAISDHTYLMDDVKWIDNNTRKMLANIHPPSPTPCWLGLLQTCRQVNSETASLPLLLNALSITSANQLNLVLKRLALSPSPITKLKLDIGPRFWVRPGRLYIANKFPQLALLEVTFRPHEMRRQSQEREIFAQNDKLSREWFASGCWGRVKLVVVESKE